MRTLTSLPTFKASSRAALVSNLRASYPIFVSAVVASVSKYHRLFFATDREKSSEYYNKFLTNVTL